MTVFLSNIPAAVIKRRFGQQPRRWIYLGASEDVMAKLVKVFPEGRIDYARDLYDISEKIRPDFVDWIDRISLSGAAQKEWFFSVPATKNPYSSQLFLNVCYFLLAKKFLECHKDIDLIIVDSLALSRVLSRTIQGVRCAAINRVYRLNFMAAGLIKSLGRFVMFVQKSLRVRAAAKSIFGDRARAYFADSSPRTMIRNFITKEFTDSDNDMFERHFFPNLHAYLQEHHKKPIFLPIAVNIASYQELFAKVKASRREIIFAEEFLKAGDYLYAFGAPLRAASYRISSVDFQGQDLNLLVQEDYALNWTDQSVLNGILLSCLGLRLKESGLMLETIINWSEFQSFEKGLMAGLREAYPEVKIIGSQPFCPPENHLSLMPSAQDRVFKVLPDKLLVLGPVSQTMAKKYVPQLKVDFTPAFRYQSIFDFVPDEANAKDLIVLFGYGLANSLFVLRTLIELKDQMPPFRSIYIKLHPATYFKKERLIREVGLPIPENMVFIDGILEQYLSGAMIGICGATGTAVELVARGIPVVVVAEETALTMHYLTGREHPELWRLCFSQMEIINSIQKFYASKTADASRLRQAALDFQKTYFAEPDGRNWENYLTDEIKKYDYAA